MSALTMRWERIGTAMPPRKKAMRRQGRHSLEFKMQVVQYALSLPEGARIKPTCRQFQNIAPVQVRKWLRAYAYKHTSPLSAELGDEGDGEDSGSDDDDEEEGATPASAAARVAPDRGRRRRNGALLLRPSRRDALQAMGVLAARWLILRLRESAETVAQRLGVGGLPRLPRSSTACDST